MIQDIYPHKLHNEYNPAAKVQENSPILNIHNGNVLIHTEKFDNGIVVFPLKKELPEEAKLVLQNSYTKRLLAMVAILLIGFKVDYFNWVAVVIPMFFPRITIGLMKLPIFRRKEEE